jgi:hypothetical protein
MINNSKQNCIDSLSGSLTRTANWRRGLQARYPNALETGEPPKRGEETAVTKVFRDYALYKGTGLADLKRPARSKGG